MNKAFRGEVWNNVDESVLEALVRINAEPVDGKVGHDGYTARATAYLQSFFTKEIAVLYTINGTAANIVALKAMLDRYGAVVCAAEGITCAWQDAGSDGSDFAAQALEAARRMQKNIWRYVTVI